jgi:hypothetical protein
MRFVQLGPAVARPDRVVLRGKGRGSWPAPGSTPPEVRAAGYRELCEHARDGRIRFAVETYPLDRIADAWERQASGSPGVKIVVDLSR